MNILNKTSVLLIVLSFSFLIFKIFAGLDFTDELQYYGQIKSLLIHEKLFVEDLFIQQFVYIFYLPFFKVFQWLNPDLNGLILFGRFCLFFTVFTLFFIIRKLLNSFSITSYYFAFSCICIAVATKIFAISYGSISLILSSLIIAIYLSGIHFIKKNIFASLLCVMLCFTHPSFGICLTSLWVLNYYIERQRGWIYFVMGFGGFTCLIFGLLVFTSYLDFDDFLKALKFSSNYNNAIILKINKDMQVLGFYWLLSTVITFFVNFRKTSIHSFNILYYDKYFTFFTFTFTFSITFLLYFWNSFSFLFSYLFYFISIFISLTFSSKNEKYVSLFLKLHWSATFTGTMIAITSGNGLQAFSQGSIVFIPFLVLILVENINISKPFFVRSTLIFSIFTVLVSALWALRHPYRDQRIPNLQHELDENIFSGLNVSRTKKAAISWLNKSLHNCGIEDGQSALVIGGHPWIYFASKLEPTTPVTFMHFRAKSGAFEIIAEEISSSPAPEVIIIAEQPPPNIADSVHKLLKKNVYKTYEMNPPLDLQENLYNEIHYRLESPLIIHRLIK